MCSDCHESIDDRVKQRKEKVRSRVDRNVSAYHWAHEDVPWRMHRDVMGDPGFNRMTNVTWEEQILLHGDGKDSPGPQYAFADKRFRAK